MFGALPGCCAKVDGLSPFALYFVNEVSDKNGENWQEIAWFIIFIAQLRLQNVYLPLLKSA